MTLATILVFLILTPGPSGYVDHDQSAPAPQTPVNPAQNSQPQTKSPAPSKATPGHPAHRKKVKNTDCSSSTSANSGDSKSGAANSATDQKPCPPKKVIVKNGGSDEPTVELKGDTPPAKASNDLLNTEQLHLATEDNLKKIAGRQLTANQQEMVDQIKQFMDQSKAAVADGDLERGHNLAMKARLLSDELAGP
jgi:hypothetical protein